MLNALTRDVALCIICIRYSLIEIPDKRTMAK